ncbi:MAG: divalent-cation tolerance protein CutA [Gemmatimonadota bacterium]
MAEETNAAGLEDVCVVLVTVPNVETGEVLAREMVEERLAACGNVVSGLVSLFWWEDEVQREKEALVVLKTVREAIPALEERVTDIHPYAVPEFLVLPVAAAFEPYARWIGTETRPTPDAG